MKILYHLTIKLLSMNSSKKNLNILAYGVLNLFKKVVKNKQHENKTISYIKPT